MASDFWFVALSLVAVVLSVALYRLMRDVWPTWPQGVQSLWFLIAAFGAVGLPLAYYLLLNADSSTGQIALWFCTIWPVVMLIALIGTAVAVKRTQRRP